MAGSAVVAEVAQPLRACFGPDGTSVLVRCPDASIVLSSDGLRVITALPASAPLQQLVRAAARRLASQHGDAVTLFVLLAADACVGVASLAHGAQYRPPALADALYSASQLVDATCSAIASVAARSCRLPSNPVAAAVSAAAASYPDLADAVASLPDPTQCRVRVVGLAGAVSGALTPCQRVPGVVVPLSTAVADAQAPGTARDAALRCVSLAATAVLLVSGAGQSVQARVSALITSPDVLQDWGKRIDQEDAAAAKHIAETLRVGIVLQSERALPRVLRSVLEQQYGVVCVDKLPGAVLVDVAVATGAQPAADVRDVEPSQLGYCDTLERSPSFLLLHSSRLHTLVLRSVSQPLLDDRIRSASKLLMLHRKLHAASPLLPGAGCTEALIARQLRSASLTCDSAVDAAVLSVLADVLDDLAASLTHQTSSCTRCACLQRRLGGDDDADLFDAHDMVWDAACVRSAAMQSAVLFASQLVRCVTAESALQPA